MRAPLVASSSYGLSCCRGVHLARPATVLVNCAETTTTRQNIVLKRQAVAERGRLCSQRNNADPVAGDE